MVAKATLFQHPEEAGGLQVRGGVCLLWPEMAAWWAEEASRAMVGEVKMLRVEQGGRGFLERGDNGHPQMHAFLRSLTCS